MRLAREDGAADEVLSLLDHPMFQGTPESPHLFELNTGKLAHLKSQFATSSWGGRRKLPLAFTEHGAITAATVLNSPRAVEVSVYVVRPFVELRDTLGAHKELANRLDELESRAEKKLAPPRPGHRRHPLRHPEPHDPTRIAQAPQNRIRAERRLNG